MSEFKWGILGTGGIAHAFARDLALLEGHTIGAVGVSGVKSSDDALIAKAGIATVG